MINEQAVRRYPSFLKIGEDGVLEMYLDNHMLSSFRKCQGYFYEQFLGAPEGMMTSKGRVWSLEFGQYLHKCLEYFYQGQRDDWEKTFIWNDSQNQQNVVSFLQICSDLWKTYDLDYYMDKDFKQHIGKNAHNLGGHEGALLLFTQYFKTHWRQERYRFVGWELSFGRNKEVPIGVFVVDGIEVVRFYYCGRIDLIVDDSEVIGPLDHKSTAFFDGKEREHFKPHDGMQGYCYSVQKMNEKLNIGGRKCNSTIINHISIRPETNAGDRFKKSYISYTPMEMDMWLKRQQSTFKAVYNFLINEESPQWNTELCDMWYYSSKCPYKVLHEAPPAYREGLIKSFYQIKKAWSPYEM